MTAPLAKDILKFVFRHRRLTAPEETCAEKPCELCFAPHLAHVESAIERGEPLQFVILAFPAKSPNNRKVIGRLPDLAERLAFESLQVICEQLTHYYQPGGRMIICSDGHVFGSLVGVHDDEISAYRHELECIRVSSSCDRIEFFSLEDAFGRISFDCMREQLISRYAEPVSALRKRVIIDPETRRIFSGVHRFLLEDQAMLRPDTSRNSLRQQCKNQAYELVRRSNAWSRLVTETFPDAVRLSIHPQPCHSEKVGFHLIRTANNWLTPWHGVAVEVADGVVLVKRWEAEKLRASLVRRHGRPSHFVAPHVQLKECS